MCLNELTAKELHQMLLRRQCSAVEIAHAVFAQIERTEPMVGAYITLNAEQALLAASQTDRRIAAAEEIGPLDGIPIAIKDNICTRGLRTTCASRMLQEFIPPYDAAAVERLKAAGAVISGKTNLDEFAMGSSCETSFFHTTHNPHSPDSVPGGSSGGSAAAIASGETILALGSDTGGSIRQPAAFCGIIGLRPTYGTVSRRGLVAFASSLDQIGPMGRCVEDVAVLYSIICAQDRMDATTVCHPFLNSVKNLTGNIRGLRIGIPHEYFDDAVAPSVKAGIFHTLAEFEQMGAQLYSTSLPFADYALSAYYILSSAEAASNLARFDGVRFGYRAASAVTSEELYERSRSEGFGREVKRRILLGTFVLSEEQYDAYYRKARDMQRLLCSQFEQAFSTCDVIAIPAASTPAFALGEKISDPPSMYASDRCTVPASLAGLPALSIPCGWEQGLPLGLQLIGPKYSEPLLFNAALALEQLHGDLCPLPNDICKETGNGI